MSPLTSLSPSDDRREDREQCHFRTSATGRAGAPLAVVIVNIAPGGLMARCDAILGDGDLVTFRLPGGSVPARVRWSLGGRIGCEFDRPLTAAAFYALLPRLRN